jgi:hypothetical protein
MIMSENIDREQQNREQAYSLWQKAGSPEGKHEEFWHQARELDAAGQDTSTESAKAKVLKK